VHGRIVYTDGLTSLHHFGQRRGSHANRGTSPLSDPTLELESNLRRVSPRFTHPRVTLRNASIYGAVVLLYLGLTVGAWFASGLFAWLTGLSYILYDTFLLIYVACKTYYILRTDSIAVPATMAARSAASAAPTVGVLIAAYNEAPALPATLEALLPQLQSGDTVLVVDDGSVDETARMLLERYSVDWPAPLTLAVSFRHPGLQILRAAHGGKARALNAGLIRLHTDLVVTVDADTKLAPDAIDGLRRAFADEPAMVAACCVIRPVCAPTMLAGFFQWFQTYEYIRAFCSRIAWMRADALLLVSGAFAAFRRDAVIRVGGFDPECLVEDYELIHRLHRHSFDQGLGWRVRVLSAPRALTDAPASLPSFLRQRRRWFSGFLQTQYWNCDMTFNGRYGTVGRWMLPIKALDTMQPIFGLTAFILLLVFAMLGKLAIVVPVLCVILGKIAVDLFFHVWWVHVYGRWTGQRTTQSGLGLALLAAVAEPFSFQLLRHIGATWGWFGFLTRRHQWGITASVPPAEAQVE
jgi:cellulose synthase/poly-beta-1,6-N-acetylglucosamine synthase-like glycosyltransferase